MSRLRQRVGLCLGVAQLSLLASTIAHAAETAGRSVDAIPDAAVVSLLLSLLTVLALIFALAWIFKRFGGGVAGHGIIKVLANVPVGRNERLMLVEVAGEQLLLGVTPQGITPLHTLSEPIQPAQLKSQIDPESFAGKLDQFIKR